MRGVPADKAWHTQKCRDRYAAYVKSSFDPNQFVLDDAQHELEIEGVELDLGSRAFGELDVGLELPDDVQDYEPTEDEGERGLGESFLPEGVLEGELRPGDSVGVEPAASEEADFMEVEPESLDRVPEPESDAMVNNVLFRESLGFAAVANPSTGGQTVKLGGETLVVEMPSSSKDDVTGHALDLGLTYEGMLRELSALESLAVGDVIWHVDPKQKVISTRWVSNAKLERIDGQERPLVRCRVVARDFAQGATAAQLGISAATSSAEALRTFLFYAGSKRQNVVGLDVSTAFLFAELEEEDGTVVVRLPAGVTGPNGRLGIYEGFGQSPKSCPTPPNLRELYDREEEVLERELSSEAAARYRSTLGRLSWLAMTRVDLAYYVSMLARGQASPREKHERAMRMVLRYLRHVQDFRQIVHPVDERSLRLDCYVDASWGSERSVDRKNFQSEEQFPTCLDGRSDSEAAIAISRADGLRRVRHIDLRACFIQDQLRQRLLFIFGVRGASNVADLFTKSLDARTTLKHMLSLGLSEVTVAACVGELACFVGLLGAAVAGKDHVSLADRYRLMEFAKWWLSSVRLPCRACWLRRERAPGLVC